ANSENSLGDQRPGRMQIPKNALTPEEREQIIGSVALRIFWFCKPQYAGYLFTGNTIYCGQSLRIFLNATEPDASGWFPCDQNAGCI
ncbi:hypothetical protein AAKU64_004609, partial [Undibacterium sp. GrIS 1.8]|uniref:hypothetical protein n=1 Tax=Undibacterium sp. GrIS 1.8 TaxID=3143934 RepID=UPI0033943E58